MQTLKTAKRIILMIPIVFMWACSGGLEGGPSQDSDTGTLYLSLIDCPAESYQAVYVTIKEVQVCMEQAALCMEGGHCDHDEDMDTYECQWETIATVNQTFNLLELVNGVMATLGQKDLPAGTYHQMRLLLQDEPDKGLNILNQEHPYAQYLIDDANEVHEMKVPSGYQTGIKLVHPFEIVAGLTTELILDFDVARSVVKAGKSGKYLLKPTIKVIGTHNRAIVAGQVTTDDDEPMPLGAMVTAWYEVSEGEWEMSMNTLTDESGGYMLYLDLSGPLDLDPAAYKIVAMAEGYEPQCTTHTVAVDEIHPDINFALPAAQMVRVSGTITGKAVPDAEGEFPVRAPDAAIAFSKTDNACYMTPVQEDELMADTYKSSDGSLQYIYRTFLPAGHYDVNVSWQTLAQEPVQITVTVPGPEEHDFNFNE